MCAHITTLRICVIVVMCTRDTVYTRVVRIFRAFILLYDLNGLFTEVARPTGDVVEECSRAPLRTLPARVYLVVYLYYCIINSVASESQRPPLYNLLRG